MKETSKASLRRSRDPSFVQHYFAGEGIDIGAGSDPLAANIPAFPRVRGVVTWDASKNDPGRMEGVDDHAFDFVHSSHCLADVSNPAKALARWIELLKPGGYAIITVPDEDLYGKGVWPNRFNGNHKSSFTIFKAENRLSRSVNVLELVQSMSPVADCERVTLLREGYDEARADADQTASGYAECAIEIVLRKRDVPTADQLKDDANRARTLDDAVDAGRRLVQTYPYRFDACHQAAIQMVRWNVPEEAEAFWEECVQRLPNEHSPRLYRVLHKIALGKLQEGFALREELMRPFGWRRRTKAEPPRDVPEWQGQPLAGKSIVIWSEFGLGDEIFFLRFARVFRETCGAERVVVLCQTPLVGLYEASGEADVVVGIEHVADMPDVDFWVYPHAIPAWLPLDLNALPQTVPYLRAPSGLHFKLPPGSEHRYKVGLVFKGDPTHENDRQRSIPSLTVLDDLLTVEGVTFFSLQKGAGADEAAEYARTHDHFYDVGAHTSSMAETAVAIASLDLVITVDTSVAHVAGAMGKPVWVLLPSYGDWRWHYTREDSPWYPSMRLFRRPFNSGWSEVVARVCGHLLSVMHGA